MIFSDIKNISSSRSSSSRRSSSSGCDSGD